MSVPEQEQGPEDTQPMELDEHFEEEPTTPDLKPVTDMDLLNEWLERQAEVMR